MMDVGAVGLLWSKALGKELLLPGCRSSYSIPLPLGAGAMSTHRSPRPMAAQGAHPAPLPGRAQGTHLPAPGQLRCTQMLLLGPPGRCAGTG